MGINFAEPFQPVPLATTNKTMKFTQKQSAANLKPLFHAPTASSVAQMREAMAQKKKQQVHGPVVSEPTGLRCTRATLRKIHGVLTDLLE